MNTNEGDTDEYGIGQAFCCSCYTWPGETRSRWWGQETHCSHLFALKGWRGMTRNRENLKVCFHERHPKTFWASLSANLWPFQVGKDDSYELTEEQQTMLEAGLQEPECLLHESLFKSLWSLVCYSSEDWPRCCRTASQQFWPKRFTVCCALDARFDARFDALFASCIAGGILYVSPAHIALPCYSCICANLLCELCWRHWCGQTRCRWPFTAVQYDAWCAWCVLWDVCASSGVRWSHVAFVAALSQISRLMYIQTFYVMEAPIHIYIYIHRMGASISHEDGQSCKAMRPGLSYLWITSVSCPCCFCEDCGTRGSGHLWVAELSCDVCILLWFVLPCLVIICDLFFPFGSSVFVSRCSQIWLGTWQIFWSPEMLKGTNVRQSMATWSCLKTHCLADRGNLLSSVLQSWCWFALYKYIYIYIYICICVIPLQIFPAWSTWRLYKDCIFNGHKVLWHGDSCIINHLMSPEAGRLCKF